jgi:hypothetical protein
MAKHKPYDPHISGPQIHDRRATQINRGTAGYLTEAVVPDPYDPSSNIVTMRSTRDDPLGDRYARGHLDEAQFLAGREFQKWFAVAERGPGAIQMAEAVDGSPPRENLTDGQLRASKWLFKCYRQLGSDGTVLAHDFLVHNQTARQIAAARGLIGQKWEPYFHTRLGECLNCLAVVFGFASRP